MGTVVKTYRDLIVWHKSMELVTEVYRITKDFPIEEIYGLTSQVRRSAISIPSNIAEGYSRSSTKEYIRFLRIARGSLYELQTHLEIALNLLYFGNKQHITIHEASREIERMLSALIKKVGQNEND